MDFQLWIKIEQSFFFLFPFPDLLVLLPLSFLKAEYKKKKLNELKKCFITNSFEKNFIIKNELNNWSGIEVIQKLLEIMNINSEILKIRTLISPKYYDLFILELRKEVCLD